MSCISISLNLYFYNHLIGDGISNDGCINGDCTEFETNNERSIKDSCKEPKY